MHKQDPLSHLLLLTRKLCKYEGLSGEASNIPNCDCSTVSGNHSLSLCVCVLSPVDFAALAEHPNVHAKLSGLTMAFCLASRKYLDKRQDKEALPVRRCAMIYVLMCRTDVLQCVNDRRQSALVFVPAIGDRHSRSVSAFCAFDIR